ncbi:MAG: hypothetical protein M1834_003315 [Cirrosporium novae-zelandiae]|nr:MAG: hypothetical protein M1834_003315 [Cirrosporium novae-zelandiae]
MVNKSLFDKAFAEKPDIKKGIYKAIQQTPQYEELFESIASYTNTLKYGPSANDEPPTKRRKVIDLHASNPVNGEIGIPEYTVKQISFSVPVRKKLNLELRAPFKKAGIWVVNPTTGDTEASINYTDIQYIICVPVPERAQRSFNFIIFPHNSDGIDPNTSTADPIVFTVPDAPAETAFQGADAKTPAAPDAAQTYETFLREALFEASGIKVLTPDAKEFSSANEQAHRRGEKAYHVKAHRTFKGSKEGFLFFLPTGIFWGFKKPLAFFSFGSIDSVSYTSILQRTFNLNISARPSASSPSDPALEIEFQMVDQADYSGIDAYVKRHGLQDASLAEQRRAKMYNVNKEKGENGEMADANGDGGEPESELAKAEQMIQDEEDEEEEDYEPDDGDGDSDGSGTSSEEEDEEEEEYGDEDEDDEDEGRDLVQQELGSEAEDVMEEG